MAAHVTRLLLLALALVPFGVHGQYAGTQSTGATVWSPPGVNIALDTGSSFPLIAHAASTSSATRTGISTTSSTTLIVVVADAANNTSPAGLTVAWSGGTPSGCDALTARVENHDNGNGSVVVATAACARTLSSASIVATGSTGTYAVSLSVYALVNASTVAGQSAVADALTGTAANVTVASTTEKSWILGGGYNWTSARTISAGTGTTLDENWDDGVGDRHWSYRNSSASSGGSVTLSCTGHTAGDTVHMAALEIKVAGSLVPPTYNAYSGAALNSQTTLTWSHTTGSGADKLLVVIAHNANGDCSGSGGGTITGVTYGGTAMTLYGTDDPVNAGNCNHIGRGAVYYMVNPPSGAANIVVSGTVDGSTACTSNCPLHGAAVSLFGAAQTSPIRGEGVNGADTGQVSTTASSSTNDYVIAYVTSGAYTNGGTWANSLSERAYWNIDSGTSSNNHALATLVPGSGSTQTGGWTPAANDNQSIRLVSVKPGENTLAVVSGYPIEQEHPSGSSPWSITLTASSGTPLVAGQPILLLLTSDGQIDTDQTFNTPTSSNLTWTLVARSNARSGTVQAGTAEVWKAAPASNLTSNESVSLSASSNPSSWSGHAVAVAFRGASTAINYGTANSATSAQMEVTVPTTSSGSLVYAVGIDWSAGGSPTAQSGETIDHTYNPTGLISSWAQHKTTASEGGNYVIGTTNSRAGWNMVGVEIKPQ